MIQYLSLQGLLDGDLITVVLVGLAAWRISHLLIEERGPWDLLVRLRELFGVRHNIDKMPDMWPDGSVFSCVWCMSVWVVLALALLPLVVSGVFAACAVAVAAQKAVG